jgi:hypothetical protein
MSEPTASATDAAPAAVKDQLIRERVKGLTSQVLQATFLERRSLTSSDSMPSASRIIWIIAVVAGNRLFENVGHCMPSPGGPGSLGSKQAVWEGPPF